MKELPAADVDAFGAALDALRREVLADLGQADVDHIRAVVRTQRYAEAAGRLLLHVGLDPATFVLGTGALAVAKILENMEIGHNVMHGQYDWTGDPQLDSRDYEWDLGCTGDDWRRTHNVEHHTYTNVLGRDRDVGYAFLRVADEQPWNPSHLLQPVSAALLALGFQWGVGAHGLRIHEWLRGEQSSAELVARFRPFARKAAWQLGKDYVLFPLLAFGNAPRVAAGNLVANVVRNVWAFGIIFCGHFPEGVSFFHEEELTDERRGAWYLRQIRGSANLDGGPLLHVLSGHLSYQIEHHLFPEIPASRYPAMAPHVRAICERFGVPYRTGPLRRQFGSVVRKLVRHAVPGGAPAAARAA